ncbi:methyl-accepting chemotaxis protein [Paenibacillus abyssi]|uniref:Methyl-accepting chemotaxis protein n=1 Tax=Paenibacillus abyssi TaxID=1340531 RepID=A0A917CRU0_9BACL|nr:methyl-accepting chemotaxis protein [Paenibacillus abyssi]GGF97404.1 methyl-accepting chemotaxis protein [Paenibacillus abyssi]
MKLLNVLKFSSIRKKLIVTFMLVTVVPIIVLSYILYSSMGNTITEDFNNNIHQSMMTMDNTLNEHFSTLRNNVTYLSGHSALKSMDDTVRSYINGIPEQAGASERRIQLAFEEYIDTHPDYSTAFIGTEYGGFTESNNDTGADEGYDPRERGWYKKALENPDTAVMIEPYQSISGAIEVTSAKTFTDREGNITGVMAIAMTMDKFNVLLEKMGTGQTNHLLVALPDGTIITYPHEPELNFQPIEQLGITELADFPGVQDGSYEMNYNGKTQLVNIYTSEGTGWRFVSFVENEELLSELHPLRNLIIIITIIIIAIVLTASYMFSRRFSGPIQLITDHARQMASGDLTNSINYHSNDELGNLTKHFNEMIGSLRDIVQRVKQTTTEVKTSAVSVTAGATDAALSTQSIVSTMSEVASGVNGQVSSLQESTTAMGEVSTAVQRVAESASNVAELALVTSEQATKGMQSIEKSTAQMNIINEATNETVEVVNRLIERTKEIEEALNTIADISAQTNLLALNAAIEAARAGDAGRGFAVVAGEVRKLAEQSSQSASQINDLLGQIGADSSAAVQAMGKVSNEASQGAVVVLEAGMGFEHIVKGINEITLQAQEASAASQQMSASAEEINASMEDIVNMSKQVASKTNQTAAAAQEQMGTMENMAALSSRMESISEELENLVLHFKTEAK